MSRRCLPSLAAPSISTKYHSTSLNRWDSETFDEPHFVRGTRRYNTMMFAIGPRSLWWDSHSFEPQARHVAVASRGTKSRVTTITQRTIDAFLFLDFHWYPSHWFHTLRIYITLKTPVFITDKLRVRFDACVLFYNAIYKGRPFFHVVRPNKNRTRVYLRPYVAGTDGGMNRWRRERRHRRPRELTRLFYWHKHNLLPIR